MAKSKDTLAMPGEEMMGSFPKYKVESAMRSITEAHEHMANPEMMKHVKKLAKAHGAALNAINSSPISDDDEDDAQENFKKQPSTKNLKAIYQKKFGKTS